MCSYACLKISDKFKNLGNTKALDPGPRVQGGDESADDGPAPDEELQFALLFVVPRKATNPAQLENGIKFCLEWFEADTTVPSFENGEGGGPELGF